MSSFFRILSTALFVYFPVKVREVLLFLSGSLQAKETIQGHLEDESDPENSYPVLFFKDRDGKTQKFVGEIGTNSIPNTGKQVNLLSDRLNPKKALPFQF